MQNINNTHASIFRRGAAMVYDGLLCFAVAVVASLATLPFSGGKGSTEFNPVLTIYFVAVFYLFFGWFWTHGGQTLGMRAWHTKLLKQNNEPICWQTALVRYLLSLPMWFFWFLVVQIVGGYGQVPYLSTLPAWLLIIIAICWTVFDHIPNNWRDRISKTKIIYISK